MAKVKFEMPDALQQKFERLQKGSGELIDKCVQAGADVFENAIRNNLRTVLSGDHQNGELVNSLGVTPVLTDREGETSTCFASRTPIADLPEPVAP